MRVSVGNEGVRVSVLHTGAFGVLDSNIPGILWAVKGGGGA